MVYKHSIYFFCLVFSSQLVMGSDILKMLPTIGQRRVQPPRKAKTDSSQPNLPAPLTDSSGTTMQGSTFRPSASSAFAPKKSGKKGHNPEVLALVVLTESSSPTVVRHTIVPKAAGSSYSPNQVIHLYSSLSREDLAEHVAQTSFTLV